MVEGNICSGESELSESGIKVYIYICEIGEFWQEASKAWKLKLYPHLLQALIKREPLAALNYL